MSGESESSALYWIKESKAKISGLKILITVINLLFAIYYSVLIISLNAFLLSFGVYYFFQSIWLIILLTFFVLSLPFCILLFWLSYRKQSDEFHDMSKKMIATNSDLGRDIIALFGNLLVLVYLLMIMFTTIFDDFSFVMIYSPIFILIFTNFEILGSSMAYIQIIRNWNDRPE